MTDLEEPMDDIKQVRTYKITYHSPHTDGPDDIYGTVDFESTQLPSHIAIVSILDTEMPDRPRGGWYEMESQ